jgi:hypothetical protein
MNPYIGWFGIGEWVRHDSTDKGIINHKIQSASSYIHFTD